MLKNLRFFEDPRKFSFEVNPRKPSKTEVRMRAAFLRLRVKVLRFFRQKGLRFFEDKTSKTLKFRGEDEASIFEEFYHPNMYSLLVQFGYFFNVSDFSSHHV